ncbi:hypothetical protein MNB_SM-4-397 [hydrothermal vent metagenome]|uniref:Uncharacterized protein n=1 Tax=hydrothermal vent metagenome TaxID=652676 RepID=A0A1W1BJS5_9ZZZZ
MKIIFILLMVNLSIFAEVNDAISIDAQIDKIKNAPAAERVELMNAFKMHISEMNQEERSHVISKMQTKMAVKPDTPQHQAERMQMQNSEQISNYQNMNQNQAGNQVLHDVSGPQSTKPSSGGSFMNNK